MKRLQYASFAFLLLVLTSCSLLGIESAKTFNERLAGGYATVTGIRDTAASLLTADKITAEDAQNVQAQADNARTGLDIARAVHTQDPAGADNKLSAIITGLTALEAYLKTKGT